VINDEVLHREARRAGISCTIKRWKANWIGYILCRNCLLKHVNQAKIEGGVQVKGKQGIRRKQLLYDLKETRGYWRLHRAEYG
jgi:hypothetical protein